MTEQDDFGRAIIHLNEISRPRWDKFIGNNKTDSYSNISWLFCNYNSTELKKMIDRKIIMIPNRGAKGKDRGRILLPPIEHEPNFVPLLSVKWDFRDDPRENFRNSIKLDLVHSENLGYSIRFDQRSIGTDHDFFHLQVNNEILGYPNDSRFRVSWLPSSKPCVPLNVVNNISSLSALIFSIACIYGFNEIVNFFHDAEMKQSWKSALKEYSVFFTKT